MPPMMAMHYAQRRRQMSELRTQQQACAPYSAGTAPAHFHQIHTDSDDSDYPSSDDEPLDCFGCVVYLVFLVIFIGMALGNRSLGGGVFFSSKAVKDEIIEFQRINVEEQEIYSAWASISDRTSFWFYLERVLLPQIIIDEHYNGQPITKPHELYVFANHLILMGGIRIRQYRVTKTRCFFRGKPFVCFTSNEFTKAYELPSLGAIPWTSTTENSEAPYIQGHHGMYPGSGFVVMLPRNLSQALFRLDTLKTDLFVDGQTRLISIDFNFFNPTSGMHTICRLIFEFDETGSIDTSYSIRSWRLLRYENNMIAVIFDVLFILFVLVGTVTEFKEICVELRASDAQSWFELCAGQRYCNFWNFMDWIAIVLNWVIIGMLYAQWSSSLRHTGILDTEHFESLLMHEYLLFVENYFLIFSGMILFLKIFKYFQFSARLSFVFTMLGRSALDMMIFLVVISIFISAFGFGGYIIFSTDVLEFRSLYYAIGNMSRAVISGLDYDSLLNRTQVSNWIFASIFYIVWGVVVILILANVFIAILSESYANVQIDFDRDITLAKLLGFVSSKDKQPHQSRQGSQQGRSSRRARSESESSNSKNQSESLSETESASSDSRERDKLMNTKRLKGLIGDNKDKDKKMKAIQPSKSRIGRTLKLLDDNAALANDASVQAASTVGADVSSSTYDTYRAESKEGGSGNSKINVHDKRMEQGSPSSDAAHSASNSSQYSEATSASYRSHGSP